jgi:hypothetical protein
MSPAAVLLLLHADMYRAGGENWHAFGQAARTLAARLIGGEL